MGEIPEQTASRSRTILSSPVWQWSCSCGRPRYSLGIVWREFNLFFLDDAASPSHGHICAIVSHGQRGVGAAFVLGLTGEPSVRSPNDLSCARGLGLSPPILQAS